MRLNRRTFLAGIAGAAGGLHTLTGAEENPPEKLIRIAQLGTSHGHAAGKCAAVRGLPSSFDLIGLAPDSDAENAAYRGLRIMRAEEILGLADLDAVLIEANLDAALEWAEAAVMADKHVHLDKPGAADHARFARVRREADEKGLVFQMGYMLRHNPAFELMRTATAAGWFGQITEIDAAMSKIAGTEFLTQLKFYPGAGMFELGCHLVDMTLTLLGEPESITANVKSTRPDGLVNVQSAVLDYPVATAFLRCSHASPFGGGERFFSVSGDQGGMRVFPLESGKAVLSLTEAKADFKAGKTTLELPVGDRYQPEFRAFAEAIHGRSPLPWSAEHDIAVHRSALLAGGAKANPEP